MNNREKTHEQIYVAPSVEVIEIAVEQCLASSHPIEQLHWDDEQGWE